MEGVDVALFLISSKEKPVQVLVRSRCISCVRQMVVEYSGADEFDLWGSRDRSTVQCLVNGYPNVPTDGRQGIIKRIENE